MLIVRSLLPRLPLHHHKMMVVDGEEPVAAAVVVEVKNVKETVTMAVDVIGTVIAVTKIMQEVPCQESEVDRLLVTKALEEVV